MKHTSRALQLRKVRPAVRHTHKIEKRPAYTGTFLIDHKPDQVPQSGCPNARKSKLVKGSSVLQTNASLAHAFQGNLHTVEEA